MKRSPFFIEEYASLSISMKEGATRDEVTAQFPDLSVMRGILVPFRRVWQKNKPAPTHLKAIYSCVTLQNEKIHIFSFADKVFVFID
jgi:hypothetical protein